MRVSREKSSEERSMVLFVYFLHAKNNATVIDPPVIELVNREDSKTNVTMLYRTISELKLQKELAFVEMGLCKVENCAISRKHVDPTINTQFSMN